MCSIYANYSSLILTTTPYACHAFQHVSTDGSATENGGPRTAAAKVRARQTFRWPVRVTPRIVLEIPPPVDLRFWNKTLQKFRICVLVLWTKAVNRVSAIFIGRTTYQFLHFLRLERSILRMWFSNFSNLRYRTISRHFALTSAYSFHS